MSSYTTSIGTRRSPSLLYGDDLNGSDTRSEQSDNDTDSEQSAVWCDNDQSSEPTPITTYSEIGHDPFSSRPSSPHRSTHMPAFIESTDSHHSLSFTSVSVASYWTDVDGPERSPAQSSFQAGSLIPALSQISARPPLIRTPQATRTSTLGSTPILSTALASPSTSPPPGSEFSATARLSSQLGTETYQSMWRAPSLTREREARVSATNSNLGVDRRSGDEQSEGETFDKFLNDLWKKDITSLSDENDNERYRYTKHRRATVPRLWRAVDTVTETNRSKWTAASTLGNGS